MVTGRAGDEFRYPISISVKKFIHIPILIPIRDGNGAGRGRVSLSHTHPAEKIYPQPHTQIQRVSNFCPIPIPTG